MYWVSRKIMTEVLPNPYNPLEKMKLGKANQIFSDIKESYLKQYENTWDKTIVPLEYFAKEYSKRSGLSEKAIIEVFTEYYTKKREELFNEPIKSN